MDNLVIKKGQEITKQNIIDAIELDYQTYDDVYFVDIEQCYDWVKVNPDIYIMAFSRNELIGYINFSPVSKEFFDLMLNGKSVDTVIEKKDIRPYVDNSEYYVYFSSIVVKKNYQHCGVAKKMLMVLKQLITDLAIKRHIYFTNAVADAVSEGGEYILSKLGFKALKDSNHHSTIMTMDFFDNDIQINEYNDTFIEVYRGRK